MRFEKRLREDLPAPMSGITFSTDSSGQGKKVDGSIRDVDRRESEPVKWSTGVEHRSNEAERQLREETKYPYQKPSTTKRRKILGQKLG